MNEVKYISYQKTLSVEEAEKRRKKEVMCLLEQLKELHEEFLALVNSDLPTTELAMREVRPGDEGYEDAHYTFNCFEYDGDFKWTDHDVDNLKASIAKEDSVK
jgi:hypothetical protein